jgi:tRNA threonylcarbamoyladenosine biosynthesis protein TsaE
MDICKVLLPNEYATTNLGFLSAKLSSNKSMTIYLNGDVGAGKTTFSRSFLYAMGYTGLVKSPTYTFIETYKLSNQLIYHFDLYRIYSPEELECIGIHDFLSEDATHLVEWASKGRNALPFPDLTINFIHEGGSKREVTLSAGSSTGVTLLQKLSEYIFDKNIVEKIYIK